MVRNKKIISFFFFASLAFLFSTCGQYKPVSGLNMFAGDLGVDSIPLPSWDKMQAITPGRNEQPKTITIERVDIKDTLNVGKLNNGFVDTLIVFQQNNDLSTGQITTPEDSISDNILLYEDFYAGNDTTNNSRKTNTFDEKMLTTGESNDSITYVSNNHVSGKDTFIYVTKIQIDTVYLANRSINVNVLQEKQGNLMSNDSSVHVIQNNVLVKNSNQHSKKDSIGINPMGHRGNDTSDSSLADTSANALSMDSVKILLKNNEKILNDEVIKTHQSILIHQKKADSIDHIQRAYIDSINNLKHILEVRILKDSIDKLNILLSSQQRQQSENHSETGKKNISSNVVTNTNLMDTIKIVAYYKHAQSGPMYFDSLLSVIKNKIKTLQPNQIILSGYTDIQGGYEVNRLMTDKRLNFWLKVLRHEIALDKIYLQNFSNLYANPVVDDKDRRVEIRLIYRKNQ